MKWLKIAMLNWQINQLKKMVVTENVMQEVCSEIEVLERELYTLQMKKAA